MPVLPIGEAALRHWIATELLRMRREIRDAEAEADPARRQMLLRCARLRRLRIGRAYRTLQAPVPVPGPGTLPPAPNRRA